MNVRYFNWFNVNLLNVTDLSMDIFLKFLTNVEQITHVYKRVFLQQ